MILVSNNYEETVNIGKTLGERLKDSDIVCLSGDLGCGKTAIVCGIARAKGHNDYVSSPTFTIVNEYDTSPPIFHFDVYRVYDPDELFEIGFEEYFERKGIVLIEWANLISEILPKDHLSIKISRVEGNEDMRQIEITAIGGQYADVFMDMNL